MLYQWKKEGTLSLSLYLSLSLSLSLVAFGYFVLRIEIFAFIVRYVHFTNLEEKSSEKPVTAKEEVTEEKLRIPHKASQTYIPKPNIPKQQPSTVFTYSLSSVGVGRGQITSVSDPITKTDVAEQSVGRGTGGLGRGILRIGVDDSLTFLANRGQVGRGHQAGGMASKMFSSVGTGRGAAR